MRRRVLGAAMVIAACGGGRDSPGAGSTKNSTPSVGARPIAAKARASGRVVLFVGTSLTAGLGLDPDSAFPQRIGKMIDSARLGFTVVNAGVSGETTAGALRRIEWLLRQPFDVMVLETGANDGLRGTDVAATQANIRGILDRVRTVNPSARVVLVQMEALPNMGAAYTKRFHDIFPALARQNGLTLLPFLLQGVAGDPQLNQADGVHPNDEGERRVAENVWHGLLPVLRSSGRNP